VRPARDSTKSSLCFINTWAQCVTTLARRRLCSRLDEKRNSDEGNNYQGGASDKHITDMISCGARSHGYLVAFSNDWTFVRIHWELLSWAQHGPLLRSAWTRLLFRRTITLERSLSYSPRISLPSELPNQESALPIA
jgi:hypothetical protein